MKETGRFTKAFFDGRDKPPADKPIMHRQKDIHYPETANVIHKHFEGKTMIEAGCGEGWITGHLQELGEDCSGFDIAQYAVDQAVCPKIAQADILDCINWTDKWELVFCINVFAYFQEDEMLDAFKALKNIMGETLFMSIQTWQNYVIRLGIVPPSYKWVGKFDPKNIFGGRRRTVQTRDWYLEQAFKAGLDLDWPLYKQIKFDDYSLTGSDFRSGGVGWRGLDSIFIFKHAEGTVPELVHN